MADDKKQKAEQILNSMKDYFDKVKQVADNFKTIYDSSVKDEKKD